MQLDSRIVEHLQKVRVSGRAEVEVALGEFFDRRGYSPASFSVKDGVLSLFSSPAEATLLRYDLIPLKECLSSRCPGVVIERVVVKVKSP